MARHRVNPYPVARKQNRTEMLTDHDETKFISVCNHFSIK